jgi:hypothetical protein
MHATRLIRRLAVALLIAVTFTVATSDASACPNCKFANNKVRAQAYMYSILFMLSMPATLFAGFSFTFYRLWKKQQLQNLLVREQEEAELDAAADDNSLNISAK